MKFVMQQGDDRPSLKILNALYEYDDFMQSVSTMVDLGCGSGQDLAWWSTATTRDEVPEPLNIQCVGVDLLEHLSIARKHANITYQSANFENKINPPQNLFDVLWCHDAFQYCVDPVGTLLKWRSISSDGAMLVISVPQTIQLQKRQLAYHLPSGAYYHHTMVSLIQMLAATGWDCHAGFFQQVPNDPWIRAVVYKSSIEPKDPRTTTWYDLMESKLVPESANRSIHAHGYLRQQDLVLPWIDKSFTSMGQL
jgi:SAM-dependent methyltransferase